MSPLSMKMFYNLKAESIYNKTATLKTKLGFQDQLSHNADQKYFRMLSAILSIFIKLSLVIKIFVGSIWSVVHLFYCT